MAGTVNRYTSGFNSSTLSTTVNTIPLQALSSLFTAGSFARSVSFRFGTEITSINVGFFTFA
jgi:hypothetical protein